MRKSILTVLLFLVGTQCIQAQEVTLFDSEGEPVAYIAYEEESTIYLWEGDPVAYLENDDGETYVVGFNGKFLGWFEQGIMYDLNGNTVGAIEGAIDMFTQFEPMKGFKEMTPFRQITPIPPLKPFWSNRWSSTPLIQFLSAGKK